MRDNYHVDLAPHSVPEAARRAALEVCFEGDPAPGPRSVPLGVLVVGNAIVDLRAPEISERLIRSGLRRGWTGRDGRARTIDDGWSVLGLPGPPAAR